MACLVKGTYVMETDVMRRRACDDAELAPAWWETLGFRKDKVFIDDTDPNDKLTYGAVFQLVEPSPRHPSAPEYVVAFRGTLLAHHKYMDELLQDFWVLFNALTDYSRFKRTNPVIDSYTSKSDSVWLAGHSLGASMALEIGRNHMLEMGRSIPTFLFNPPHVSLAAALQEKWKTALYTASSVLKFSLANMLPGYHRRTKQLFEKLAPWEPELYINRDDTICQGFVDYFVERQLVYDQHPRFAMTAGRASYRDMFVCMFTTKVQPHLLPSAKLWESLTTKKEAHDLRQWWKPDGELVLIFRNFKYISSDASMLASPTYCDGDHPAFSYA
jgi:hypothetical protein